MKRTRMQPTTGSVPSAPDRTVANHCAEPHLGRSRTGSTVVRQGGMALV